MSGVGLIVAAVALQGLGSAALLLLPQFDHLGHFYSLGTTAFFLVGPACLAALGWRRGTTAAVLRGLAPTWLALVGASLAPAALAEVVTGGCRDPIGSADFLLTNGAGLAIGLAFAAGVSRLRRGALVGLAWLGVVSATTAWALAPLYTGPQVFVLHPIAGLFPGPVYDRLYEVPARYLLERAVGLLAALAVVLALRASAERSAALRAWAVALGLAVVATHGVGPRIGLCVDDEALARALPGERSWRGLTVRFDPRRTPPALQDVAWDDARFAFEEARAALGGATSSATLYVFPSDAERGRLLGMRRVSVTKPWRGAAYLSLGSWDRCTVKHELLHVLLGPYTEGWLGLPWTGGLPNLGLVEGAAEALTACPDSFPVHWQARRMLTEGDLPAPADLVSPARFWTLPGRRAYAAAASFFAFLQATRGAQVVVAAYRQGDVGGSAGADLAALDAEWRRWLLAEVTLAPEDEALLAEHLAQRSVFTERCSQERARAAGRVAALVLGGEWAQARAALDLADHIAGQPIDPLLRVRALVQEGRLDEASEQVAVLLADRPAMPLSFFASLVEADLLALRGRPAEARLAWTSVRERVHAPALKRQAAARLLAFGEPAVPLEVLRDVLLFPAVGRATAAAWRRLERESNPVAAWLLARWHASELRWGEALDALAPVLAWSTELGEVPEVRSEVLRMLGVSAYRAGRLDESKRAWTELAGSSRASEKRSPEEWLRRIRARESLARD
jgi:hypothetical protein